MIENYPEGFIRVSPEQLRSQEASRVQDAVSSYKSSLVSQGYVDKGNNVFENKEGTKRITVNPDGSYTEETFQVTKQEVSQPSSQLQQIQAEYNKLNKQVLRAEARGQELSRGVYSRLSELKQMEEDLLKTGYAFTSRLLTQTTPVSSETKQVTPISSVSSSDIVSKELVQKNLPLSTPESLLYGETVPLYAKIDATAPFREGVSSEVFVQSPTGKFISTKQELVPESKSEIFSPIKNEFVTKSVAQKIEEAKGLTSQTSGTLLPTSEVFGSTPIYSTMKATSSTGEFIGSTINEANIFLTRSSLELVNPVVKTTTDVVTLASAPIQYTFTSNVESFADISKRGITNLLGVNAEPVVSRQTFIGTIPDYAVTASIGLVEVPIAGKFVQAGFSAYSGVVGIESLSQGKYGEATVELGIGVLGLGAIRDVINFRPFRGADIVKGTIKEVPSTIQESVRAKEFLKERGITSNTVDIVEYLPYVGTYEKIKYEPMTVISKDTGESITIQVPISREVLEAKTTITPVYKNIGTFENPIYVELKGQEIKAIFPRITPNVYEEGILVKQGTVQSALPSSGVAKITEYGLIPESTGRIPLIEVSKSVYEKNILDISLRGGEFKLGIYDYSELLKLQYPNKYRGIGFDIPKEEASRGVLGLARIKYGKEQVDVSPNISPKEIVINEDIISYYKKATGQDISNLKGKTIIESEESVLAHELVHATFRLKGIYGTEAEAFGFNIANIKKSPEFLVSFPEQLSSKGNVISKNEFSKLIEESRLQSEGRPISIVNVNVGDIGLASFQFNKFIPEGSRVSEIVPTSKGSILFTESSEFQSTLVKPEVQVSLLDFIEKKSFKPINQGEYTVVSESGIKIKTENINNAPSQISQVSKVEQVPESKPFESKTDLVLDNSVKSSNVPSSQSRLKFDNVPSIVSNDLSYSQTYKAPLSLSIIDTSFVLKSGISNVQEFSPKISLEVLPSLKTGLEISQKQLLETKQELILKEDLEKISSPSLRNIPKRVQEPKPPEEPVRGLFVPFSSSVSRKSRLKLEVRRRGKFQPIQVGESVQELSKKGESILKSTLAASFRIVGESGRALDISIPLGFSRSKRSSSVIVQPRGQRLASFGERFEIRSARRLK